MASKIIKKDIKTGLGTFFRYCFLLIKSIVNNIILAIKNKIQKTEKWIKIILKTLPLYIIIKQIAVLLMFFYYVFQVFFPTGFLNTLRKAVIKNVELRRSINKLQKEQFYLDNTIKAISEKSTDAIEEIMINNTGKELNKKRDYIVIE
jgi:hypothetical protein